MPTDAVMLKDCTPLYCEPMPRRKYFATRPRPLPSHSATRPCSPNEASSPRNSYVRQSLTFDPNTVQSTATYVREERPRSVSLSSRPCRSRSRSGSPVVVSSSPVHCYYTDSATAQAVVSGLEHMSIGKPPSSCHSSRRYQTIGPSSDYRSANLCDEREIIIEKRRDSPRIYQV